MTSEEIELLKAILEELRRIREAIKRPKQYSRLNLTPLLSILFGERKRNKLLKP